MDEEHCVIAIPYKVCEVLQAADKRRYNVFFIMSCRATWTLRKRAVGNHCPPLIPASAPVETTLQNYNYFPIWQKLFAHTEKRRAIYAVKAKEEMGSNGFREALT